MEVGRKFGNFEEFKTTQERKSQDLLCTEFSIPGYIKKHPEVEEIK